MLRLGVVYNELWNVIARRELWQGVRFDDTARTMEDWDILPVVLAKATRIASLGKPIYHYRASAGSLTHQVDESMQCEMLTRALGRLETIRRLGLWRRYQGETLCGVGYAVYCRAESLVFSGHAASPTKRTAISWLRRHLPQLLLSPASPARKAKWVLAACGLWAPVRWVYRRQGRV